MVKWPHRECFCSQWQQTWTTQRTNQKLRQWSSKHLSRVKWLRPRNSPLHLFSGFAETNFLFNGALVMWLNIRKRKLSIFTRVPWLTFPVRMSWFKVLTQEKIPLSNVWFSLQIYRPNNWPSRREISIKLNFVNCMHIKQKKRRPFELPTRFSGVSTRTKIGKRTLYWYKDIIKGRDKMHS